MSVPRLEREVQRKVRGGFTVASEGMPEANG